MECIGFKCSKHNVVHSFVSETFMALHNSIKLWLVLPWILLKKDEELMSLEIAVLPVKKNISVDMVEVCLSQ